MNIQIITDSTSDIPQDFSPNITVLPMTITFGERSYRDGIDLDHRDFYEKLIKGNELPSTSQIVPTQFSDAIQGVVQSGKKALVITLSSRLSGTYQSACIAAEDFPGQVWVVDSENATIGEGILIRRALELAERGLDCAAIAAHLDREKKNICLIALLDTLEYLKRGGRLSPTAAKVGGLLSIKPVVGIRDGKIVVLGKTRGAKNGHNLLMEEIRNSAGVDFKRPYALGYTGLSDTLLQKYIADSSHLWADQVDSLPISTVGATIGTHVGPGAIAVAFFRASLGD